MPRTRRSLTAALVVSTLASGALAITTPQAAHAAGDPCGSTNGLTIGTGTDTYLGVPINQATIKTDALAAVKKWRQDALNDTAVKWGGKTMKAYLASQNISQASYLNPQWDYNLERIAAQRAAEASVSFSHTRPNGSDWHSLASNGTETWAEIIAASSQSLSITSAINDQWAAEKAAFTGNTGAVTGHYTTLIDPQYLSYGFGDAGGDGGGYATGEASTDAPTNTASTGWSGTCQFRIALPSSKITGVHMTPTTATVGQTAAITTTVTAKDASSWPDDGKTFTLSAHGTVTSASPTVATASGSSLTGVTAGTSAISMTSGDQTLKLGTFTVTVPGAGFTPFAGTKPAATNGIGEATGDSSADVWALGNNGTLDFYRYANAALTRLGVRGQALSQISYMAPIPDQNGDGRADMLYRDSSDQSLWFAYSQGNGYLTKGMKVGSNWGGMDTIFYAGTMSAGSSQQYLLARRTSDGTLWRYALNSTGLGLGVQIGNGWGTMRVMLSPGTMSGDAGWDVLAIRNDGVLLEFESRNGLLVSKGQIGHGWTSMTSACSPGDITGDGRLDLMGQRSDGTLWAYANTTTGFTTIGQVGAGFGGYRQMA